MNQNKIKIAVVDDDESYACALERLFRASGFEVRTYCSAETFLAAPPLPGPDCLVLDFQNSLTKPLELVESLCWQFPHMAIVAALAKRETVEWILGARRGYDGLTISPCLSKRIPKAYVRRTFRGGVYDIHLDNSAGRCTGARPCAARAAHREHRRWSATNGFGCHGQHDRGPR